MIWKGRIDEIFAYIDDNVPDLFFKHQNLVWMLRAQGFIELIRQNKIFEAI